MASGLGLALALPLLANLYSLAAQPTNAPAAPSKCYAQNVNSAAEYESPDASAVQGAVDAAAPGSKVKLAGTCQGVSARRRSAPDRVHL